MTRKKKLFTQWRYRIDARTYGMKTKKYIIRFFGTIKIDYVTGKRVRTGMYNVALCHEKNLNGLSIDQQHTTWSCYLTRRTLNCP